MNQLQNYPSGDWKLSYSNGSGKPKSESTMGLSNSNKKSQPSQIDQSDIVSDGSTRRRNGLKGMTLALKRQIRSGCVLMETIWGLDCLSFLTCTVPVKGYDHRREINLNWKQIVRKFIQELKRLLDRKGLPLELIWITELQPKLLIEQGTISPHLHIVFVGRNSKRDNWAISPTEIRNLWNRLIANHYKGRSFDGSASTRIERLRKSVRNYMSKYMSKGGINLIELALEKGLEEQIPECWGRVSTGLKNMIEAAIEKLSIPLTNYIEKNLDRLKELGYILWYFRCEKEFTEPDTNFTRTVCFGIVGSFSDGGLAKIKALYQREGSRTNLGYHSTRELIETACSPI